MESPSIFPRARGFTLIELLVVVSLMAALLGLGLLMSMDVFRGTTFRSTRQVLVSALTTARARALANDHQSAHGVCYRAPDFILFRGTTYSATNASNERIIGNPKVLLTSPTDSFTCGTGAGIVFAGVSAQTAGGTITVTEEGHTAATITVNAEGTIIW